MTKSLKYLSIILIAAVIMGIMYFCKEESLVPPVVLTIKTTQITTVSAVSGGNIASEGDSPVTERGVCWDTVTGPTTDNYKTTDGRGQGIFESNLSDLQPGTIYYLKAYAKNKAGITYGFETSFSTIAVTPVLTTADITDITTNGATSGGVISSDGGYEIIAKGVCWDTLNNPTINDPHTVDGTGTDTFESCLTGLLPDKHYFVRSYATNSKGTAYGRSKAFTTYPELGPIIFNPDLIYDSIEDVEGNVYKTIQIGTQIWMAENLRTTKLNDGTDIHFVPAGEHWNEPSPAYCVWYNGFYGAIYNFYTVSTGKLCPLGWHLPSYEEVEILADYLGGRSVAGGKLKETGTTHWREPNAGATNSSGFSALPGGYSPASFGAFTFVSTQGRWWLGQNANIYCINKDSINIYYMGCMGICGMTVRCIKD